MSIFQVGQFRKDLYSNYTISQNFTQNLIITQNNIGTLNWTFAERVLITSLNSNTNYFLKLGITRRTDSAQTITIKLSDANGDMTQTLLTYTIPQLINENDTNRTAIIETVFSPNSTYNKIVLELSRTSLDLFTSTTINGTIYNGRIISLNLNETAIYTLTNILTVNALNHTPLLKIGVQGHPGLLMCINGEEIRIGPSGIYEIKNGYEITFLGFAITPTDLESDSYFILDYTYES